MRYKLLFHISALLLIATEAYRTFLLAPFPGSQETEAVATSFFLYHYRWIIRIVLFAGMIIGFKKVFEKRPWIPMISLFFTAWIFYVANYVMTAEAFFKTPSALTFTSVKDVQLPADALLIGVTNNGESKAYPIRYLSFHHQVLDTVGGKAVLVTYCDVCRSASVFSPETDGKPAVFRLVGMDRFNAMLEDENTGSWFMQANGECVAGKLKGTNLPIVNSEQLTLYEWSARHPDGKVMLPDAKYKDQYGDETFEKGTTTDELTHTDTTSWQDKSWVIGVEVNGNYRAYDWIELKRNGSIQDTLGGKTIAVIVDDDGINYYAEELKITPRTDPSKPTDGVPMEIVPIPARQMFWHTWRTFYPTTTRYVSGKVVPAQ